MLHAVAAVAAAASAREHFFPLVFPFLLPKYQQRKKNEQKPKEEITQRIQSHTYSVLWSEWKSPTKYFQDKMIPNCTQWKRASKWTNEKREEKEEKTHTQPLKSIKRRPKQHTTATTWIQASIHSHVCTFTHKHRHGHSHIWCLVYTCRHISTLARMCIYTPTPRHIEHCMHSFC